MRSAASLRSLGTQLFHVGRKSAFAPSGLLVGASSTGMNCRSFASGAFSMELLKQLRSQSGAPIGECKKALTETGGDDMTKALDWLRQHGVAKATSKVGANDASEGLVGVRVSEDGTSAAIVKVSAETDFASRSADFATLITAVADDTLVAEKSGAVDTDNPSDAVKAAIDEGILAIRENLSLAHAMKLTCTEGKWVGYVHGRLAGSDVAGTAAAVVHVKPLSGKSASPEVMQEAGKKLAMHVVAAKPAYFSPETVPEDILQKEKSILMEQVGDSKKPADIVEKIVNGRMRKFYEGACLTEQPHMVEEGNPKVSKALSELGLEVTQFEAISI